MQDFQAKQTTVGEVCLGFLLDALADAGRSDLLYAAYSSRTSGYGLQVEQGKTSLTEGWNGGSSQDHFMFGQLNEWLFSGLAGIRCDPGGPGFQKIIIRPGSGRGFDGGEGKLRLDPGPKIVSEWKREWFRRALPHRHPAEHHGDGSTPLRRAPRRLGRVDF